MSEETKKRGPRIGGLSEMLLAGGVLGILFVLIVPLPATILDLSITMNIGIALMVLLITLTIRKPLEFSTFPSLLLFTTLYRLALNVASTRMILSEGKGGTVIASFGNFVVGGDLVVGLVIFLILLIIQFVVITKGSNRISEVAARFTLDAMPGKQMAIDADLNAGIISEQDARNRREEIAAEAEFYGSMDGAGKFVRGDAIAGLIITVVNIIGGIAIGMSQGLDIGQALEKYALLTVGDGLVSQIPALVIAISAGVLVTKARSEEKLSNELAQQFLVDPQPLRIAALMVLAMGLVPGLPTFPFLVFAGLIWVASMVAVRMAKKQEEPVSLEIEAHEASRASEVTQEVLNEILKVDRVGIEIGYRLIPLVDDKKRGNLLDHIAMVRKQFAQTLGFVVPPIRMRDNLSITPNGYRLLVSGQQIGEGELYPDHVLAMNPGGVADPMPGIETTDPTFGMPALWVPKDRQAEAESAGYTVVDPESVLVTHLTELIKENATEILNREDVQATLDRVKATDPTVVGELVPDILGPGVIQQVLGGLLRERVPIRDMTSILETLADQGRNVKDPEALIEFVRQRLARTICDSHATPEGRIEALTLAPALETQLVESMQANPENVAATAPLHAVQEAVLKSWTEAQMAGRQPVLLVRAPLRRHLAEIFRTLKPAVPVLSYNEVLGARGVDSVGMVEVDPANPAGQTLAASA